MRSRYSPLSSAQWANLQEAQYAFLAGIGLAYLPEYGRAMVKLSLPLRREGMHSCSSHLERAVAKYVEHQEFIS